jgi:Heterokaryon incompatibility protein (HET)
MERRREGSWNLVRRMVIFFLEFGELELARQGKAPQYLSASEFQGVLDLSIRLRTILLESEREALRCLHQIPHSHRGNRSGQVSMELRHASQARKDVPLNLIETSFAYDETLHSRTIRLLRLLPGTGGEKLCCQLFKRRLCSPLRYKALSYAWGDTSDSRNVYCDNKVIKVTSNLFSALWQLREKETYEYLWVDAICINQLNLEEKTNQVRLMLDIFKRADIVIIWLGEQRETDRIAVNLAYQIYGAAQMVGFEKFARMVFRGQATAFPPVWTHHWRALWSLLDREWFARVWVVQEFVVAKGFTMLCG